MAEIHHTTMTPGKLTLLTDWLPRQAWFAGGQPLLAKAGGFRLDDPDGEVGIEVMIVTDSSGDQVRSYLIPLTYRGAALDTAPDGLIGTSEHGVLGRRWIYDGTHDPVFVTQLVALLQGDVEAQDQNVSATADPSVTRLWSGPGRVSVVSSVVADHSGGTDLFVAGAESDSVTVRVVRRLGEPVATTAETPLGSVRALWQLPDGASTGGELFVASTTHA